MVENPYTNLFLHLLITKLQEEMGDGYQVVGKYKVHIKGRSTGFFYDIGIESRDYKKLILIELELGGKTPVYNYIKTLYWHNLEYDKTNHVLFLHIFTSNPKSKNRHVSEDMTIFVSKLIESDLVEYKHINFPLLKKLQEVKQEFLTKSGKTTTELEQQLNEATKSFLNDKDKSFKKTSERLIKTTKDLRMHKNELEEIRKQIIERISNGIVPILSKQIVDIIEDWKVK